MALNAEQIELLSEMILEDSSDGDIQHCYARLKHVIADIVDDHEMPELEQADRKAVWAKLVDTFTNTDDNQLYTIGFMGGAKKALLIDEELTITL